MNYKTSKSYSPLTYTHRYDRKQLNQPYLIDLPHDMVMLLNYRWVMVMVMVMMVMLLHNNRLLSLHYHRSVGYDDPVYWSQLCYRHHWN